RFRPAVIPSEPMPAASAAISVTLCVPALKSFSILPFIEALVAIGLLVSVVGILVVVILIGPESLAFLPVALPHGYAVPIPNIKSGVPIASLPVIVVLPVAVAAAIVSPAIVAIVIGIATPLRIALQFTPLMSSLRTVITMLIDGSRQVSSILPDAIR